jgi:hypothetical protein
MHLYVEPKEDLRSILKPIEEKIELLIEKKQESIRASDITNDVYESLAVVRLKVSDLKEGFYEEFVEADLTIINRMVSSYVAEVKKSMQRKSVREVETAQVLSKVLISSSSNISI